MSRTKATPTISLNAAREYWFSKQGLRAHSTKSGTKKQSLTQRLENLPWARTLGGVDAYLSIRARLSDVSKAQIDQEVASGSICPLPAVRGCIYLVPNKYRGLALLTAKDEWLKRTEREVLKAGASWGEVETLMEQILEQIDTGFVSAEALRKKLPTGAIRSLKEPGKNSGISTLMPIALRALEFEGHIQRGIESGALDNEKYVWSKNTNPLDEISPEERAIQLAKHFFSFNAPATCNNFAEWSGLSAKASKQALVHLKYRTIRVPGYSDECYIPETELESVEKSPPTTGDIALLSFDDSMISSHGGTAVLTDEAHHTIEVPAWGMRHPTSLGKAKHIAIRVVLIDGSIIGLWEADIQQRYGVWCTFTKPSSKLAKAVDETVQKTSKFLFEQLGHVRSFSLDNEKSQKQRVDLISTIKRQIETKR